MAHETTLVWKEWFGPFDEWAIYQPSQKERAGFAALLLLDGEPRGFVKSRPNWDSRAEYAAHRLAAEASTFWTPRPRGTATLAGWTSLGLEPLPKGLHSPRLRTPVSEIASEASQVLHDLIEDEGANRPMHGDMGPWNLRRAADGYPVLFDWEHVALAPPGADVVFHTAASQAMGIRSMPSPQAYPEAVAFWREEIPRRFGASERDAALRNQMLASLNALSFQRSAHRRVH